MSILNLGYRCVKSAYTNGILTKHEPKQIFTHLLRSQYTEQSLVYCLTYDASYNDALIHTIIGMATYCYVAIPISIRRDTRHVYLIRRRG